jgi:hypothetical protein
MGTPNVTYERALKMYIDHINEVVKDEVWDDDYGKMSLIFIDDDDIPELVIYWGISAYGCQICTVSDGKLICEDLGNSDVYYIESQNIFATCIARWYYGEDIVYAIKNGEFTILHTGEYVEDHPDKEDYYLWDGKEVTESEYMEKLRSAFDRSKAVYARKNTCSSADMLKKINGLLLEKK